MKAQLGKCSPLGRCCRRNIHPFISKSQLTYIIECYSPLKLGSPLWSACPAPPPCGPCRGAWIPVRLGQLPGPPTPRVAPCRVTPQPHSPPEPGAPTPSAWVLPFPLWSRGRLAGAWTHLGLAGRVGWDGGASEDKLPHLASLVHGKAHGVPEFSHQLPLVDEAGRCALQ